MGRGALLGSALSGSTFLQACVSRGLNLGGSSIPSLAPNSDDNLTVVDGLYAQVVVRWQDKLNSAGDFFGTNNDFLTILPGSSADDCFLWANHEYIHPLLVSGYNPEVNIGVRKTKQQADIERKNVGGSFLHLKRKDHQWILDFDHSKNFRIDATTPIKIISDRPIVGSTTAIGTLGNCSGGRTPWNTILTCEENFQDFYGHVKYKKQGKKWKRHLIASSHPMAWDDHYPLPPEHFGWVVEVHPTTREAKKLTALGRFAHEGALVLTAKDGRCVVYMGDDTQDEHFYKFIAKDKGSLEKGDLYVANLERGRWEHLSIENPLLRAHFVDQTDLLIRTREAAKLLGATPLDRPEGCAQDPIGKGIFVNCTMNKAAGRPFGSIMKFTEKENDLLSMEFSNEVFLNGGELTGFACPDNMCFDARGNLWITTDIADYDLNTETYKSFGNNALYFIPLSGIYAGKAFRFVVAPKDAELTGPCFSEDGKTLFLSVQHPGANTTDVKNPTSHWPDGGDSIPRSSVIALSGPLLEKYSARV